MTAKWDESAEKEAAHAKAEPKYRLVKQHILSWMHAGQLQPGEQMPSENELADRFRVSRQTIRHTFDELEKEGWLYRIQGKGTFASAPSGMLGAEPRTIGVITTYISDYIFPHIVSGIESALRQHGYRLVLSSTDNNKAKERESLQLMMNQPISGLIVEPTKSAEGNPNVDFYLTLQYRGIPYLMIHERYQELTCPCLRTDDEGGGYAAAEHVIQLGHRHIAGLFKTDDMQGVRRLRGFVRALQDNRIPLPPDFMVHYSTEEKHAKPLAAADRLLRRSAAERPTAIVCYNDELAVALLDTIRRAGLRVPDDVSIVGFDDSPLATATEVKLTTVVHPKNGMGTDAAETMVHMIEKRAGAGEVRDKTYEALLIVRDSTRRL